MNQSRSAEDDDNSGGKYDSEDASESQPKSAEDGESGGGEEGSTATSTEDDDESGGEWTTNRVKEAKRGPVRLKVGGAITPVLSFPVYQSPALNGEGPGLSGEGNDMSGEGAKSQTGNTVSFADKPSLFPRSFDSGDGESDVSARDNPQVLPPRERHLSGNKISRG